MIIPIMFPSSAEFWLNGSKQIDMNLYSLEKRELCALPEDFSLHISKGIVEEIMNILELRSPLHVMASSPKNRNISSGCVCHVKPEHLPPKSFICIKTNNDLGIEIYMSSPEFTFLQAAAKMKMPAKVPDEIIPASSYEYEQMLKEEAKPKADSDFLNLVILGTELCSMYIHDSNEEYEHKRRNPVLNVKSILDYLALTGRFYGVRRAIRASRYILDNSNSPMETITSIFLILPIHLGGFGLPKPCLNVDVKIKGSLRTFCCDMVWEVVIVEYDSDQTHMNSKQHAKDSEKYNILTSSGYKVVRVTAGIIRDFAKAEETFMTVRRYLKIKNPSRMLPYKKLRKETLKALMNNSVHSNLVREDD